MSQVPYYLNVFVGVWQHKANLLSHVTNAVGHARCQQCVYFSKLLTFPPVSPSLDYNDRKGSTIPGAQLEFYT